MDEQTPDPKQLDEAFDFDGTYANNSRFESSVWDLKILFGQLEQHSGHSVVDWHTAVTMPWMQAKILCYYLRLNVAFHEVSSGSIRVHKNVLPPKPEPPAPDIEKADPAARALYEIMLKVHTEMFGDPADPDRQKTKS